MSENIHTSLDQGANAHGNMSPALSGDNKKARGRIPRGAWGYVLGLYDLANETLKMIGDRYGVEPSAVHYVLRQARKKNVEPTLTAPSADVMATPRRLIEGRNPLRNDAALISGTTPSRVATEAARPVVNEAMAQAIRSPLAKRVMDASAEIINSILHYEKSPTRDNGLKLDEARKSGLRALAAIEIWMHQAAALQARTPAAANEEETEARERVAEMA